MFNDYAGEKIMRYASGDIQDLNRIKQQMTNPNRCYDRNVFEKKEKLF